MRGAPADSLLLRRQPDSLPLLFRHFHSLSDSGIDDRDVVLDEETDNDLLPNGMTNEWMRAERQSLPSHTLRDHRFTIHGQTLAANDQPFDPFSFLESRSRISFWMIALLQLVVR